MTNIFIVGGLMQIMWTAFAYEEESRTTMTENPPNTLSSIERAPGFTPAQRKTVFRLLLILGAAWWIYLPVLHGGWLWEDNFYLPANALLHDPHWLWKIWFSPGSFIEYYPITETVQWVQWQLWQNDTFRYHVTNVILHGISALLVWRFLSKLGLRMAWLGGLLFAVHPVMVESVAWITEIKNTLSLPPFLLAMIFYLDYEQHGDRRDYFRSLGLFLAAMLCKITMATFPFVILLYAWWKRKRVGWSDLRQSAPFFIISCVLGATTLAAGDLFRVAHQEPPDVVLIGGLLPRLALVATSFAFYFCQSILPILLLPVYPRWTVDPPSLLEFLPYLVLAGVLYWLWSRRTGWGRPTLLGLGFFLILLAPFLGFHAISYMNFTWVQDHQLYIPIIGLIGLAVAGFEEAWKRFSPDARSYGGALIAVLLGLLAWKSHAYTRVFNRELDLWTYTLKYNPNSWMVRNNLGEALAQAGRAEEAITQFNLALELRPAYAEAHNNLGNALLKLGRFVDAAEQYEDTLILNPHLAEPHVNLGVTLVQTRQIPEAMDQFQQALLLNPRLETAYYNRGLALASEGKTTEAMEQYRKALEIYPDYLEAQKNLGILLFQAGQLRQAMDLFIAAVEAHPDSADAHDTLGVAMARTGNISQAAEQFQAALRLDPDFTDAQKNLDRLQNPSPPAPGK